MPNNRTAVCKEKIYCFEWIIAPFPGTGKCQIANVIYIYDLYMKAHLPKRNHFLRFCTSVTVQAASVL